MMSHKEFLLKFASTKEAATAFGVQEFKIRTWKLRGIPAKFWHLAERISAAKGFVSDDGAAITAAVLAATKPAAKSAA
jgi:hypothetical protein